MRGSESNTFPLVCAYVVDGPGGPNSGGVGLRGP